MVFFCPTCGNILLTEHGPSSSLRLFCRTCPYIFNVNQKITSRVTLQRKQIDDVLGGEEAWKNVDQTDAICDKCGNRRAYFFQIQIRSADEPMSIFFKCTKCSHQWREG